MLLDGAAQSILDAMEHHHHQQRPLGVRVGNHATAAGSVIQSDMERGDVAGGGRYGTGWPGAPVDERPSAGHCRCSWPAMMKSDSHHAGGFELTWPASSLPETCLSPPLTAVQFMVTFFSYVFDM